MNNRNFTAIVGLLVILGMLVAVLGHWAGMNTGMR